MNLGFMEVAMRLDGIVEAARVQLRAIDDETAGAMPAPGKWSKKEILGHLVDSASNNQQRLVRGQSVERLDFPPYDQTAWVRAHGYGQRPWADLRELWLLMNKEMVEVLRRTPQAAAGNIVNLGDKEVTLAFIAEDYVRHLVHHLEQIGCKTLPYQD